MQTLISFDKSQALRLALVTYPGQLDNVRSKNTFRENGGKEKILGIIKQRITNDIYNCINPLQKLIFLWKITSSQVTNLVQFI